MSGDDDPLKVFRERIEAKQPIMQTVIDLPIQISLIPQGILQIDAPLGIAGFEQAGIQRLFLMVSPGQLRAALEVLEKSPDTPVELARKSGVH